jgi:hypothetical protein
VAARNAALAVLWATVFALVSGLGTAATTEPVECGDAGSGTCAFDLGQPRESSEPAQVEPDQGVTLELFWGIGCPHCEQAKPFVDELEASDPELRVRRWEVRQDEAGRAHFIETMQRLGAEAVGIPTFVVAERYVIGFQAGSTEEQVRALIRSAGQDAATEAVQQVDLPLLGELDVRAMSLPSLTVVIGLLDGINPCAMWVLLVLLGVLMHVQSRARLLLFGGTFVVMSGVVYFFFMTAWSVLFSLVGLSKAITVGLGVVVLVMGLINLKELFWFKRGLSLTIPERAKPGLFRRMRGVAAAASLPAAFLGVAALAFVVNLIELGCTLGLPAVYTRILSLRQLSTGTRYAYLALYNVVYVVPLAVIVVVYAATLQRLALSERGAKVLKAISGVLLVVGGLVFVFWPEVMS